MTEDFHNEIEAINSIYGERTLTETESSGTYSLQIPGLSFPLRLQFPSDYPSTPPSVLGSNTSGTEIRREDSHHAVEVFKTSLGSTFEPGQVCLFDIIEDVTTKFQDISAIAEDYNEDELSYEPTSREPDEHRSLEVVPPWTLSDTIIELKSIFIARAAPVSSPDQAKKYLTHLLESDKKVRAATHNITAWRIKGENGVIFQDCDDDGETAAGGRVLHLMQLMDLWNVMVVVTRWYGGHHLGPKRFSLINAAARDAFVKGNFVDDNASKKKGKR